MQHKKLHEYYYIIIINLHIFTLLTLLQNIIMWTESECIARMYSQKSSTVIQMREIVRST